MNLRARFAILLVMHSAAVVDHFKNPRNAGDLPDATAAVDVSNPVCGDVLRLSVRVDAGKISAVRFKAQGCVATVASASALTELLIGKSLNEAWAVTAAKISDSLGGLPPATFHGAQLASDALVALFAKLK
ncbi:MAG TPA: iron-sulfur cluster assembly scaffold protein [Candidatus Acidoferrales bacterium]|nr:iron-sulfur cluster assembly scaffold protein [Candidatus Acidoferrales bacterium]